MHSLTVSSEDFCDILFVRERTDHVSFNGKIPFVSSDEKSKEECRNTIAKYKSSKFYILFSKTENSDSVGILKFLLSKKFSS